MKQKKGMTIIITVLNILLIAVCVFFTVRTDRKAPAFSFEKSELIYQEGMQQAVLLEGITAFDDKDGDVTDRIVIEKTVKDEEENVITVFYAVSDSAGNIVKTSRVFPADFKTVLTTGERGLWTDAALNNSENEMVKNALTETEVNMQKAEENNEVSEADEKNADEADEADNTMKEAEGNEADEAKDVSAKKLEEERKKLEEETKKLKEEKKQLEEERKQLEEERRRQAEEKQKANAAESRQPSENQSAAENKPKDQQPEGKEENAPRDKGQKPVITLKAKEVNTTVGNPPAWVNLIQSLKDDRDNYETLFYSLSVSKYDLNKAGSYPVTLTVTDSDGNVSAPVSLTINVN